VHFSVIGHGEQAMEDIERLIEGSKKLIDIFGYWPSFHDAEVIELHFWRGDVDPDADRYIFPLLRVNLHVWEMKNDLNSQGFLGRRHHTLATLRFHDVNEFRMEGFNHQNAILGLSIIREERDQGPSPIFAVHFDPAHGMGASFICTLVEVVDAVRCSEDGKVSN
jgi:Immunity protein 50